MSGIMENNWQGRLRSIFAYSFPLLLGALFLAMFVQTESYLNRKKARENHKKLLEQSRSVMSRIQSEFSLTAQLETVFRQMIEEFFAHDETMQTSSIEHIAEIYQRHMPPEFASAARVWAFQRQSDKFDIIDKPPFATQKRAAMARVFSALFDLSKEAPGDTSNKTGERFIVGVFGENSAPEYLASSRFGRMTPVIFEGRPHYLFWQKFERNGRCSGGFIALFAANWVENPEFALERLSEKVYRESAGEAAAVFTLSPTIDKSFKPVMAKGGEESVISDSALVLLKSAHDKGSNFPTRQLQQSQGYWLYKDMIADGSPYIAWLLINAAVDTAPAAVSAKPAALIFAAWTIFYWYMRRNSRFKLKFAFRLLFFMTGMLPVLALLLLGLELIDQSADAIINERVQTGFAKLKAIDEKSEDMASLAGMLLRDIFRDSRINNLLVSEAEVDNQRGFADIERNLQRHKYALSYLHLFKPGHTARMFATSAKNLGLARYYCEYLAISCNALHEHMSKGMPDYQPIILSSSQKTTRKAFGGAETQSTMDVFLDSLERISTFEGDNNDRQMVYSLILTRDNKLATYVFVGLNIASTLLEMIIEELQFAEKGSGSQFFCLNRDISAGQKIYPDNNHKFLNSQSGRQFRKFLEAAATSDYQMQMHIDDEVYIYEPLPRVKLYYAGAIIPIKEIKAAGEVRRTLLYALVALLASSIYLLSASVSSLIIKPTGRLAEVFAAIAEGSFNKTFAYTHNNELGMLARATDSMISGLKERKLLGKFVSRTFDNEVLSITSTDSARELYGVILFSDIRNFTTLSESNSAETIAELLNNHLKEMVEIINHNGGEIEQFIGDAIVAFFPGEGEKSCQNAIHAARLMMLRHHEITAAREMQHKLTCQIGIGLDYGLVMAGVLKAGSRSEFCVIGPARATAEKFEGLSKSGRHTRIIVGHSVISQLRGIDNLMSEHADNCCELKNLEVVI
jgi:adenylate cyclase